MGIRSTSRTCLAVIVVCASSASIAHAQESQGFSSSNIQVLYGATFQEPGISEDVNKSIFTFENTAAGQWWSSYLFVDVLRSWSDADANAKEVYGEWYPSLSLRKLSGSKPAEGFVRDVSVTMGLNTGVRSTGPAPFVVLPGVTFDLNVPGFKFLSVGAFAYIDRGQFQGQPTGCRATTFQVTPSWSLPFKLGDAGLSFDGFVDFIGSHGGCEAMVLSQPQLKFDLSALWHKPGQLHLGVEWDYWHNKYGIAGLEDKVLLPLLVWVF
jgi:nucleoside-specific outer membrane channel protein Tsx